MARQSPSLTSQFEYLASPFPRKALESSLDQIAMFVEQEMSRSFTGGLDDAEDWAGHDFDDIVESISFGALEDDDWLALRPSRFGFLSRRSGVRWHRPAHYPSGPADDPYGVSRATGVRGKHLGWRYPRFSPDWDTLLAGGVVQLGRASSGGSRGWRGRLPQAVGY